MSAVDDQQLERIIEAALMAVGRPLSIEQLLDLFEEHELPTRARIRKAIDRLTISCEGRSVELKEIAGGFRMQIRADYASWVSRLWEERPARYSRALLETLALIAYRQPITRGEIEDIRGVAVSSNIVKTLLEREWVRVLGHRDVPGRPALYGTTKAFLDYFNLASLDELPTLAELRDLKEIESQLTLELGGQTPEENAEEAESQEEILDTSEDEEVPGAG